MEKQEKVLNLQGEAQSGPLEKAGKDAVKAELSFFNLGVERAKDISKSDERLLGSKNTIRQDLIAIIKSPQESWSSYRDGFKQVLDERKKDGKPIMSLTVVRSNISRVLNAAKGQPSTVIKLLEDKSLRWEKLLKGLPKVHPTMGAPLVEETKPDSGVNPETETNVGTLLQVITAAAQRMVTIGKAKKAPFAHYIGVNVLETVRMAQEDFRKTYDECSNGGVVDNDALIRKLGLAEVVTEQAAAAIAA